MTRLDLPTIQRTKPSNLMYATLGTLFKGRSESWKNSTGT